MEGHLYRHAEVFHGNDWRLEMDNDQKHTSWISKQWIEKNIPNKMPWLSRNPNINPMENLFGWVKQKLVKEGPKTIAELKWKLEEIWGNIEPEFFIPYWKSMVTQCNMVREGAENVLIIEFYSIISHYFLD